MNNQINTKFKNTSVFVDQRGTLVPVEHTGMPIEPQRTFVVCNVPMGTKRGGHAHYSCQQYAVVVYGEIKFELFDGMATESFILRPGESVLIDTMIWDTQEFLTEGAVLLVFCSIPYNRWDYITDIEQFKLLTKR